jgi:hypothetical protein
MYHFLTLLIIDNVPSPRLLVSDRVTRFFFHVAHTLAVQEEEPEVQPPDRFGMSSEPKASPLQLAPLVCGFWGSSLQSLDLSGCHFLSNTFADQASCMMAMERLVLREARGDTLQQVVGGWSVWG